MPQMAPMNWTIIYVIMSTLFITCSIKLYFLCPSPISKSPELLSKCTQTSYMPWKW